MLGAIIGDIVGPRFNSITTGVRNLICSPKTASSRKYVEAMKVVLATIRHDFNARLSDLTMKYMQEIGRKYPNCGFNGMFYKWVFSNAPNPYNSFGNGAAMRVSPVGCTVKW